MALLGSGSGTQLTVVNEGTRTSQIQNRLVTRLVRFVYDATELAFKRLDVQHDSGNANKNAQVSFAIEDQRFPAVRPPSLPFFRRASARNPLRREPSNPCRVAPRSQFKLAASQGLEP